MYTGQDTGSRPFVRSESKNLDSPLYCTVCWLYPVASGSFVFPSYFYRAEAKIGFRKGTHASRIKMASKLWAGDRIYLHQTQIIQAPAVRVNVLNF